MRMRLAVLAVVAVIGLDACQPQASAGASAGLAEADRAALTKLVDSTAAIIKAHNWDVWAAGFTDDAVFLPPNHPMIHGRAAIRAWVDSFPTINEFAFTNATVDGSGSLAWGTTGIPMSFTPPGGALVKDVSKQLAVWRKQPDGAWKVVAVAFNSDLPMPNAPAAPTTPAKKGK